MNLCSALKQLEEYKKIEAALGQGISPVNISGLTEASKAHLAASVCLNSGRQVIFVTDGEFTAKKTYEDILFFCETALYYPAKELEFYEVDAKSNEYINDRLTVLSALASGIKTVVVMSIDSLLQFTVDIEAYTKSKIPVRVGESKNVEKLVRQLGEIGYTREDMVEGKGQFSLRGGILDIFTPDAQNPYRIEFFGDEIDSIREFDVFSQTSIEQTDAAEISAVSEELGGDEAHPCAADFIDKNAIVIFNEPHRIKERAETYLYDIEETVKSLLEKEIISEPKDAYIHEFDKVIDVLLKHTSAGFYSLLQSCTLYRPVQEFNINVGAVDSFSGKLDRLIEEASQWLGKDYRIVILGANDSRLTSLFEKLSENNIPVSIINEADNIDKQGQVYLMKGFIKKGFYYPEIKLLVISDSEVFGRSARISKHRKKVSNASKINSFTDLDIGDYVVHQVHGIGEYVGIDTLIVEGNKRDYLKIKYKGEDFLYVPTESLDLLQKYIGKDEGVHINKMGGAEFARQKQRVKDSTKELAEELVKLYAKRQQSKGFAFSKDTEWQKEFEDKFPYDETEDQLTSTREIKADMESGRPMDRLLCGDVGYGKTEVALRAIFKAVMDGKQVAYLAPTTVLTMQHYNTFINRMKDYPVTIELLSRFKTGAEQKKIIKRLKNGDIDIVIGTHRLLGKDIEFKELGLLVVDEEQRFGVKHKERIKEMKANVDVLTLSATPIPRTLHMSMINIKDMSLLTEPPEERLPVVTFVMEQNMPVLADAIKRELARGGQVYYLHNRIDSIQTTAKRLQGMLGEDVRLRVAHGQMAEDELEDIMMDMLEGEIDVLVCTTIIETGLDIPNVNTIVIEDADKMGLSQLYQLKGRVGRSNRRAYAYLTYKKDKILNEVAVKRLQAIKEFTEFGSGFKIAMRDLEIRGAGSLLGSKQHGHMDAVGYDMYCRLLEESVAELSGQTPREEQWQPVVDYDKDAFIPPTYIKNHAMRLEIYKKIAACEDEADVNDIYDEILDRFGEPPQSVMSLLDITEIRTDAKQAMIEEVTCREDKLTMFFKGKLNLEAVAALVNLYKGRLLFSAGERPYVSMRLKGDEINAPLGVIKNLLEKYIHS